MYISLAPTDSHQVCSSCGSVHTIRRGKSAPRHVRHPDLCENHTMLVLPTIRLTCKSCGLNFTREYSFVEPKSKYTNAFKNRLDQSINDVTVKHSIQIFDIPYTSGERFIKKSLGSIVPLMQSNILKSAQNSSKLILGIDDFAIRKRHTYNTGIHDLRNGTLLTVVRGRKYEELINNLQLQQCISKLSPFAVVMNLTKSYHNFAKKVFPNAIRIAAHFYVNRYITDTLHSIRKRICRTLNSYQSTLLKHNKKLLAKRNDSLNDSEQILRLSFKK